VYDVYIDAETACRGVYRSADKKIYIHTALCSEFEHKVHFTTTSVTLCCQSGAAISMHSIFMMHTLMLEQLVAVSTAVLTEDIHTHCTV
jgi:hypothetical protein